MLNADPLAAGLLTFVDLMIADSRFAVASNSTWRPMLVEWSRAQTAAEDTGRILDMQVVRAIEMLFTPNP